MVFSSKNININSTLKSARPFWNIFAILRNIQEVWTYICRIAIQCNIRDATFIIVRFLNTFNLRRIYTMEGNLREKL